MSNAWVIYLRVGNNTGKLVLIPDALAGSHGLAKKWIPLRDGLAAYQLVGGVTAHQGVDG